MGWRDQAVPANAPAAAPAPVPTPTAPSTDTPAATGWRSQAVPANAPAAPAAAAPEVPWFSVGSGPDKIGEFVGKMADSATAGWGAQALDKLGVAQGPGGQTVAQQVENAGKDIGPLASTTADLAGYAVGPGKLKIGGKLAELMGGRLLARMGGAAAENAGASVAGTLGHGDTDVGDNLRALALGGTVGAITGGLPGSRGKMADTPSPTSGLQSTASQAYAPLASKVYQTPDVEKAILGVSVPQGLQAKISNSMSDQIDRIKGIVAKGGQTTANDIADFRASLLGAAKNDTDMTIAGKYVSALEKGVGSKTAADIGAANTASGVAKTSGDIDNWIKSAQQDSIGTAKDIQQSLKDNPNFYGVTRPGLDAASQPPGLGSRIATGIGKDVAGTLAGSALEGVFGDRDPLAILAGGAAGLAATHGVGAAIANARGASLAAKLAAARHLNATGQTINPSTFRPGYGPLADWVYGRIQQAVPGIGASGGFMPR